MDGARDGGPDTAGPPTAGPSPQGRGKQGFIGLRSIIGALAALLGATATAALAAPLPHVVPEAVGFSSPRLKRLDETLQALVDTGQIAGGVTLLAR
ncbi:MAG: beta-lactamase, partial [Caulobacter sp.]|nr:beta-lactamase [Caulobacter sp.]